MVFDRLYQPYLMLHDSMGVLVINRIGIDVVLLCFMLHTDAETVIADTDDLQSGLLERIHLV